jgi:hypothetical protein
MLPICGLESVTLPTRDWLRSVNNRYSPLLKSRVNTSFACYFTVFFLLLPVSSLFSHGPVEDHNKYMTLTPETFFLSLHLKISFSSFLI